MPMQLRSDRILLVFERKFQCKIYDPDSVGDDELCDLLNDMDMLQRINSKQLRLFGHIVSMGKNIPKGWTADEGINKHRLRELPCLCWNPQMIRMVFPTRRGVREVQAFLKSYKEVTMRLENIQAGLVFL